VSENRKKQKQKAGIKNHIATQEAVPDEPLLIKPYSEKAPLSSEFAKF
jgi:hypothetical protein